ncbi:MAG: hypothetical protein A3J63_04700 [Candidatus Moranbacteria bacterium RIFCSPHIGHO2_02_FULL_40_12b]|nr:MAG: hypothetical protein A3J63_04700 [Candidatus Moranbacteria bacterium RIFCSPHIGHO2_02_FULL_40_12b]
MLGFAKNFIDDILGPIAKRINISPNAITFAGLIAAIIAATTIPKDLFWGGLLILISGAFDLFDGMVARANNKSSKFGSFFDSVIDRYSDSVLLLGFIWYFYNAGSGTGIFLTAGTIIGTMAISYARAKAEGLQQECKVGIMERPERIILMALGALFKLALPMMWVMLILTHITVAQRIFYVRKKMSDKKK